MFNFVLQYTKKFVKNTIFGEKKEKNVLFLCSNAS